MPVLPAVCRCSGRGDTPGPIPPPKPVRHITTVDLCAWCPDKGNDCECTPVHRVIVRDPAGKVISQTDYQGDGITPFTLGAGCTIGPCSECPCRHDTPAPVPDPTPYRAWVKLCDWDGNPDCETTVCTPFRRLLEWDPKTKAMKASDFTVGGDEPYEVTGTVIDCGRCPTCDTPCPVPDPCSPVPMCPGLAALDEDECWTIPPGTESVSVHLVCGSIRIRTCCGKSTQAANEEDEIIQLDESGASMSWTAPSIGCNPGELCGGFSVWTGECSQAYVQYLTTDCGEESGEESESGESWGEESQ